MAGQVQPGMSDQITPTPLLRRQPAWLRSYCRTNPLKNRYLSTESRARNGFRPPGRPGVPPATKRALASFGFSLAGQRAYVPNGIRSHPKPRRPVVTPTTYSLSHGADPIRMVRVCQRRVGPLAPDPSRPVPTCPDLSRRHPHDVAFARVRLSLPP